MKNNPLAGRRNVSRALFDAVAALKDAKEAKHFLHDLCTPAELQAMADRWQVVRLLRANKSYREIYALTGVSVTTIGRVARAMTFGDSGYQLVANRLDARQKS